MRVQCTLHIADECIPVVDKTATPRTGYWAINSGVIGWVDVDCILKTDESHTIKQVFKFGISYGSMHVIIKEHSYYLCAMCAAPPDRGTKHVQNAV